ncbi:hypothetical protein [Phytomonospora endophytica]|uniref:Uncharacterized protein n=1 Tax=Phytomonospora endophytica TaxID=714109 RepID=A0A841FLW9_9ACTN|nr:hypothetical protein [Phytomonospora endophytica]MBB6033599.1 hypothetical protein [Phytomonospora endophytica]GIG64885.1 hypothetical protein Pen01_11800 [Phytomonospora endophytica]
MDTQVRFTRLTPVLAVLAAAALAAAQVALAQVLGLLELGGGFEAGAERGEGIGVTLLIWFCALSAPVAMLLVRDASAWTRAITAVPAGLATLAALPVARMYVGDVLADDVPRAVILGAGMSVVAALLVARLTSAGLGIALHAGLLWAVAVVASLVAATGVLWGTPTFFAGFVLDTFSDGLVLDVPLPGRTFGYFPQRSLVMIALLLAFTVVAPSMVVKRGGRWWEGVAVGFTGPFLAVAAYLADVDQLVMWNLDFLPLLAVLSVLGLVLTCVTVAVVTRKHGWGNGHTA